ncbi:flagellin [Gemmatimonas sp.]|jgi:flagellin|uniref:flagellin N-terminal helical domain-containing protein n=2 Tax=Gemmatimonas sp. TaxID=1962908 RepID=UPI0037C097E8
MFDRDPDVGRGGRHGRLDLHITEDSTMRINTNVGALTASRNAFVNNIATENSMRKLSSGLRISRAADDAAGLAVASKLRTQSRSLSQAAANAEQGNAMLQIAEGAAQTIQRIIERQKELITQKLNATSSTSTTTTINAEIASLATEASRIQSAATFQGMAVFAALSFQVGDGDGASVNQVAVTATLTQTPLSGTSTLADADTALDAVNEVLSNIGAGQNVLDYTVQNLKSAVVNVRAAESTIRDVDMAEEMATFTRNNILTQAAQAMLSQANQGSQGVLQLLR